MTNAAVSENLATVEAAISKALASMKRPENACQLLAVSKVQPLEKVIAALDAGHRLFGENKVQEAAAKWPDFKAQYEGVELHLIGGLQTNKCADAVALFDVIQTLDRPKLAEALKKEMDKQGKSPRLYIQVNTGEEEQKGGVLPADLPALLNHCQNDLGLSIEGLMCIPPVDDEPAFHFALLKKIAERYGLEKLSMGMSGDFELAVQMGAHYVRVGTAVFGDRDYPKS